MFIDPLWEAYPVTYRDREMKIIADWISAGESGSVVGLPGCGRSNLLGFLCYRPEVFQTYLPPRSKLAALIPVDLNDLPADDLSTFYRVILRSFYRIRSQFDQELENQITCLYQAKHAEQDPFISQSALQDLILSFQARQMRVVLVLNHFDRFWRVVTPRMVNTLRSLRDNFKHTLCYIVGMFQEVAYLPDPTPLGDMYEILDNHVCWVGNLEDQDARNLITRATHIAHVPPTNADMTTMCVLTGRFPSLLRTTCSWWLNISERPAHSAWETQLLAEQGIQYRLRRIWVGLTQEEQYTLSELQKWQITATQTTDQGERLTKTHSKKPKSVYRFVEQHRQTLTRLSGKGICYQTGDRWQIRSELLATYIANVEGHGRGKIWVHKQTDGIYQGETLIENLTALERSVLTYLVRHPYTRHTKTDLIINTWPDDLRREGVTDNSLYQVILTIRKTIELNLSKPAYLITWRGKPEGGYQFFPEGRPE